MKGDFLVDTNNPAALDATLQQLGAVLVGAPDYVLYEGHYVVRALSDAKFVMFACQQQGYAKVVDLAPYPAPWDVRWPVEKR